MKPRISPESLQSILQSLPPENEDQYPHLSELSPDKLLARRIQLSNQIKLMEDERKCIDAELLNIYSDAELKKGVKGPGGWIIQQRSRTSWSYDSDIKELIQGIQKQAQSNGQAEQLISTYLCLSFERPRQ